MKKSIVLVCSVFIISFLFGSYLVLHSVSPSESLVLPFEGGNSDINCFLLFFKIAIGNLLFCYLCVLGAGILTIPLTFLQGFQLGCFLGFILSMHNTIAPFIIMVLPHGVIEIPAWLYFCSLGVDLYGLMKKKILNQKVSCRNWLYENKKSIIGATIAIVASATIECFLTPILCEAFL